MKTQVKINPPGDRKLWSMFPLTRVPFGVTLFFTHSQLVRRGRQRLEARKVPREAKLKKLVGQTVLRLGLP